MRINLLVVSDIATGKVESRFYCEYAGAIELAKKGRGEAQQATQQSLAIAQQQQALAQQNQKLRNDQWSTLSPYINDALAGLKHNSLPPDLQASYDRQLGNVADTYSGLRRVGFRALGNRFGSTPAGAESSMLNSVLRGQGADSTAAYRGTQEMLGQRAQHAANLGLGAMGEFNPVPAFSAAQSGTGQASENAYRQGQMGSTFGDIMQGIGAGAGLAMLPFGGGSGFLGLMKNAKSAVGPVTSAAGGSGGGGGGYSIGE